ncbi:hypothetical protein HOI83_00645 [Candidatus Uhrbacteria bacterium]|jgi:hypothetical protein|nr:hypothetical protein [Candidatus Uhrbacteria bacterium]
MRFRRGEHRSSQESALTDKIFKEALALADTYAHPHYIWRAMDNLGVREMSERRRLKPLIQDRIDAHLEEDRDPAERSPTWRPKDIFSTEGREWMIEEARKHMLEYPDPGQFERDWDAA